MFVLVFFLLSFVFSHCGECCSCCCCCKNKKVDERWIDCYEVRPNFINLDDLQTKYNFPAEVLKRKVLTDEIRYVNRDLSRVSNLLNNDLNIKTFLRDWLSNQDVNFPHIHWNGSLHGKSVNLCYMLAPLNIILHLEIVREFLKSNTSPKSQVEDINDAHFFINDLFWFNVFRMYADMLENGESFTLDTIRGCDRSVLGLCGKYEAENCNAFEVISKTFESLAKFKNSPSVFKTDFCSQGLDLNNIYFEGDEIDCSSFVDKFTEVKSGSCDFDIIVFDFFNILRHISSTVQVIDNYNRQIMSDVYEPPKPLSNIVDSFKCGANTYVLKGLLFFSAGSRLLSYDNSNDYFSLVYDKNAPDKNRPFVYCQLDEELKYLSLKEIEDGINKMDGSVFSYKNNYLDHLIYEKKSN